MPEVLKAKNGQRLLLGREKASAGVEPPSVGGFPTAGLVLRREADVSLATTGSTVDSWTDSIGSRVLTSAGSPEEVTLQSGNSGVAIDDAGMTNTSGLTGLISGNAVGTVAIVAQARAPETFYTGYGYGTNTNDQARTVGWDNAYNPMFDFFGDRILGAGPRQDEWLIIFGTYDGTTARLYTFNVLEGSKAKTLNTALTKENLSISFGGTTANTDQGAHAVWDRVLTEADRLAVIDYWQTKYITDVTAPTLTSPAITGTGSSTASIQVVSDEQCTVWAHMRDSATPVSAAVMKSGSGATWTNSKGGVGTVQFTPNGLASSTEYFAHFYAEDSAGNGSNSGSSVVSSGVSTTTPDTTPPTISITNVAPTTSGCTLTWTTDEGNGTRYVKNSANASETAATMIATGSAQAVTASGSQVASVGGVAPDTATNIHVCHVDAEGNQSTVSSQSYTTLESSGGSVDATVSTEAAAISQIDSWISEPITSPKTLGIDTDITTGLDFSSKTAPHLITIRGVGTFDDEVAPVTVTGSKIDLSGSTNLRVVGFKTIGAERIDLQFATDCSAEQCWLVGADVDPLTTDYESVSYIIRIKGGTTTRCAMRHCLLERGTNGIYFSDGALNDLTIEECMWDWTAHDSCKVTGNLNGLTFQYNWFTRRIRGAPGTSHHEDMFQWQGGSSNNCTIRGNVGLLNQNWWYGASSGTHQGFFMKDTTNTNATFEQNILATNTGTIKNGGSAVLTGTFAEYNMGMHVSSGGFVPGITTPSYDYNFVTNKSGASAGEGANGILVDMGGSWDDFTESDPYFEHGTPVEADYIGDYEPASGTAMHWAFGGTKVGPWERFEQLFSTQEHVPDRWPVKARWELVYNGGANRIPTPTAYSYDADGIVVPD